MHLDWKKRISSRISLSSKHIKTFIITWEYMTHNLIRAKTTDECYQINFSNWFVSALPKLCHRIHSKYIILWRNRRSNWYRDILWIGNNKNHFNFYVSGVYDAQSLALCWIAFIAMGLNALNFPFGKITHKEMLDKILNNST